MGNLKYEFTSNQKEVPLRNGSIKVREIRALIDIPTVGVFAGDIGGHIWSETSLSQEGESWVFPGSVVHSGARVTDNATVFGDSIVASSSILEGDCRVNDSNILSTSVIGGDAFVESSRITDSSLITGSVRLKNAQLYNVVVNDGEITDSMIRSENGMLRIEKSVLLTRTRLHITDENPVMEEQCTMLDVTGDRVDSFQLRGRTRFDKVTFPIGTRLTVLKPIDPFDYSIIESMDGECQMEEIGLILNSSIIKGAVTLKGNLKITNCLIVDFASVINDGGGWLTLADVRMKEVSEIRKTSQKQIHQCVQFDIHSDMTLTC